MSFVQVKDDNLYWDHHQLITVMEKRSWWRRLDNEAGSASEETLGSRAGRGRREACGLLPFHPLSSLDYRCLVSPCYWQFPRALS